MGMSGDFEAAVSAQSCTLVLRLAESCTRSPFPCTELGCMSPKHVHTQYTTHAAPSDRNGLDQRACGLNNFRGARLQQKVTSPRSACVHACAARRPHLQFHHLSASPGTSLRARATDCPLPPCGAAKSRQGGPAVICAARAHTAWAGCGSDPAPLVTRVYAACRGQGDSADPPL